MANTALSLDVAVTSSFFPPTVRATLSPTPTVPVSATESICATAVTAAGFSATVTPVRPALTVLVSLGTSFSPYGKTMLSVSAVTVILRFVLAAKALLASSAVFAFAAICAAVSPEATLTSTPPTLTMPLADAGPVNFTVCCSPASAPVTVRAVVGSIMTWPNSLWAVVLYTGRSPTRSPTSPFRIENPFHSVVSAMRTISCFNCWNSKSR